jgi:hypothetical protein
MLAQSIIPVSSEPLTAAEQFDVCRCKSFQTVFPYRMQICSALPAQGEACCRFNCRLNPALSGVPKGEQRQITLSVNDLLLSCRTSYSPSVAW